MSGGFNFPPPPPPPPKQTPSANNQPQYNSQNRSGRGGRGGNRGRGRGGTPSGGYSGPLPAQGGHVGLAPSGSFNGPNNKFNSSTRIGPHPGQQSDDRMANGTPARTFAGQKRKLDALRGAPPPKSQPAPPTAPITPSFGSILSPHVSSSQTARKAASNSLGLTPATVDQVYSSSDEENESNDLDEESLYAELGNKLTFEHNGTILALSSAADIARWQQERKRNFPTQARVAEKEVEKRKVGEERRRLLADAAALNSAAVRPGEKNRSKRTRRFTADEKTGANEQRIPQDAAPASVETEMEKAKRSVAEKAAELDRLRQKVVESQEKARQSKEKKALEDAAAAEQQGVSAVDTEGGDESFSEDLSESSVVSSDSEDVDDEGPPEETASKPVAMPAGSKRPCRYFAASGYCRDGDACLFYHDPAAKRAPASSLHERNNTNTRNSTRRTDESASKRKGIFERLMEQEQNDSDRLALNVIKYLGGKGFFQKDGPSSVDNE